MDDINHEKISDSEDDQATKKYSHLPLTSIMDNSQDVWVVKDRESRFVYANQKTVEFFNLQKRCEIEGKRDQEISHRSNEFAEDFQKQDRNAERSGKGIAIIETHFFGREKKLESYFCDKFPFYNEKKECLGTISYVKKINFLSFFRYFNKPFPSILTLTPPTGMFTKKEHEVIFFALQGLSCKEVAHRMCLSPRTIENKLQEMYQKTGVNSLRCLREFCREKGFENYIPPRFVRPGVQFLSSITTKPAPLQT